MSAGIVNGPVAPETKAQAVNAEYDACCVACGKWIGIGLACDGCDSDED